MKNILSTLSRLMVPLTQLQEAIESELTTDKEKFAQEEEEKLQLVRDPLTPTDHLRPLRRITFLTRWSPTLCEAFLSSHPLFTGGRWPAQRFSTVGARVSLRVADICKAWRRYMGRKYRAKLRQQQYEAACIIQRAARKKLIIVRATKDRAARRIQKTWRRLLFFHVALLRMSVAEYGWLTSRARLQIPAAHPGVAPTSRGHPTALPTMAPIQELTAGRRSGTALGGDCGGGAPDPAVVAATLPRPAGTQARTSRTS